MEGWDEEQAFWNKKPWKTYVSPRLSSFSGRPIRIANKVVDGGGGLEYAKEKGEVVLQEKPPARFELVAKFLEDDRGITNLVIQKFTKAGPKEAFQSIPSRSRRFCSSSPTSAVSTSPTVKGSTSVMVSWRRCFCLPNKPVE